jgi:hypothetical protein
MPRSTTFWRNTRPDSMIGVGIAIGAAVGRQRNQPDDNE